MFRKPIDRLSGFFGALSQHRIQSQYSHYGWPGVERVKRFVDRELVDGDLKQWFSKVSCWDGQSLEPHAKFVAKIGLQKWAEGSQIDPISLLPNYFRGSAAEEKAKAV